MAGIGAVALSLLLSGAAQPAGGEPESFAVDPTASRVRIHLGRSGLLKLLGHDHEIDAPVADGRIDVVDADPARSSVRVRLEAGRLSIVAGTEPADDVPKVEERMRGPEVLDAGRYPEIVFASSAVTGDTAEPGRYRLVVKGALQLKGRSFPVEIPLDVRRSGSEMQARGAVEWRLRDLGVEPPSVAGVVNVANAFRITFDLTARRKELSATPAAGAPTAAETLSRLQYHDIRADTAGMILPWSHDDPAKAYDHVVRLVWGFWQRMEACPNGVPYYLQHQVWKPEHDPRGLGGDQLSMALSSWNLLHGYLGDPAVVANMRTIADYWLAHGLTAAEGPWPNVPFPYNTEVHSGRYDGDMVAGKGFLQPDKAGAFGAELVTLHEITGEPRYLDAAIGIADTLARNVKPGDGERSPWPFRVHAVTGEVFVSKNARFDYTTNWTGALRLFDSLVAMGRGRVAGYEQARRLVGDWLKTHPLRSQRWGPFFEDINIYSDTQINAGTMALYILENPGWMPDGLAAVRRILDWTNAKFGNPTWSRYGVLATNEQTAYEVPGNSHTSRQASLELLWAEAAGEPSHKAQAIRNLNWATYMVAADGKNRYYHDDVWLTDGYGDYVRHYLRAMAAAPELAPADQNHLLRSSSVVRGIDYGPDAVTYEKRDATSRERLKLGAWEPGAVEGGTTQWDPKTRVLEVTATAKRVVIRRRA
jgi:polyisoprenoid-binding protein YceI